MLSFYFPFSSYCEPAEPDEPDEPDESDDPYEPVQGMVRLVVGKIRVRRYRFVFSFSFVSFLT